MAFALYLCESAKSNDADPRPVVNLDLGQQASPRHFDNLPLVHVELMPGRDRSDAVASVEFKRDPATGQVDGQKVRAVLT